MNRTEFIEQAKAAAREMSATSGFPAGITVAQAALESNWGQSQLSRTCQNYFGIKAHGKHAVMEFRTSEFDVCGEQAVVAKFAVYGSMKECFDCREHLIGNGTAYEAARKAKDDPEKFARALAQHWATDPRYAEKLLKVYRENGFDALDVK